MRRLIIALILAALVLPAAARDPEAAKKAAQPVAADWLALVDGGKYGESWENTSQTFKTAVTRDQWEQVMQARRVPLGKLVSRKLKSAEYKTSLPGAPDGEYVVIQYDTSFEHKKTAVETVTPMVDKDDVWRVSGYFIR
jgi:hypothetical protein